MSETERIAEQLRRAYEGGAWHGPALREVLDGVTGEQAASRTIPAAHTIWEIVLHVTQWENVVAGYLAGETYTRLPPDKDWPPVPAPSEAAWRGVLLSLDQSHRRLRQAIARFPETKLADTVPGAQDSFYVVLHGVVQHDLYHAGQIALLKKKSQARSLPDPIPEARNSG